MRICVTCAACSRRTCPRAACRYSCKSMMPPPMAVAATCGWLISQRIAPGSSPGRQNDKRGERDGKWLGDGSVLFFARRGERTQLFRLPMAGGEARAYDLKVTPPVDASEQPDVVPPKKEDTKLGPVEAQPIEPQAYEPAPDARWIAIIAPDPETPGEKKQKDSKADALRVDHDLHAKRLYLLDPDSDNLRAVGVQADVEAVIWSKQADQFIVLVEAPNNAADLGPATTVWL